MKIWLVTGGEPLPIGGEVEDRLYRAGLMAKYFTARGHDVIWWRPDFVHRTKRHFHANENIIEFASYGRIKLLASVEPTCRVCPADPGVLANNLCEVLAAQRQPDLRKHVASMSLDAASERLISIYESLLMRTSARMVASASTEQN